MAAVEGIGVTRTSETANKSPPVTFHANGVASVEVIPNHVGSGNQPPSVELNETAVDSLSDSLLNPALERTLSIDTASTVNDSSSSITDMEDNDMDSGEEIEDLSDDCSCHAPSEGDRYSFKERIPLSADLADTLPDTVTQLETPEGCKVFLVGTAHFSIESQEDVAKTIQATQPNIVVVELCKGRVNILKLDEQTILEEAKNLNLEKMRLTIKQNGFVHGVMYLFLLSMSAHLTKQLGMAPGGEFRRAFSEAKRVPGCLIHLGDRPIQVTLQRAINELSVWQKLCLAWGILTSKEPISKEEVERCKNRDLLEEMIAEMTGKFPAFSRVFLQERDIYLTHSLQLAASPLPCRESKSGFTPTVVVGVVGIGHVPGIVKNWGKVVPEDIPPLLRIPVSSLSSRVLKYSIKISFWGIMAYGCYRITRWPVSRGYQYAFDSLHRLR